MCSDVVVYEEANYTMMVNHPSIIKVFEITNIGYNFWSISELQPSSLRIGLVVEHHKPIQYDLILKSYN